MLEYNLKREIKYGFTLGSPGHVYARDNITVNTFIISYII